MSNSNATLVAGLSVEETLEKEAQLLLLREKQEKEELEEEWCALYGE
jgi:hypothetical protein